MDPTLIYNGYHLQRRKMYDANPRSNLLSTFDLIWKQSIDDQYISPTEKIQLKKQIAKQKIKQRHNFLIQKRLSEEVKILPDQYKPLTQRRSENIKSRKYQMKDSLNEELQAYYGRRKGMNSGLKSYQKLSKMKNSLQDEKLTNSRSSKLEKYDNYTKVFDPELKTISERKSYASSQLSSIIPKADYLSKAINKKLEKYLRPSNSRQTNFFSRENETNSNQL